MGQSIEIAVKNRIIDHGRGWCHQWFPYGRLLVTYLI